MTGRITEHTVQGKTYKVWADYIMRCMYAQNEAGETKRIHGSGYLSNDLTIRKAIRYAYGLDSFRK
jgi:hypothetical protein